MMKYKVHVKTVYYLDNDKKVKKYYVGQDERLSKVKAKGILEERGVEYKKILHVISEQIKIDIPQDILQEEGDEDE